MTIGIILAVYLIESIKYTLGLKLVYKEDTQRKWGYVAGGVVLLGYLISIFQSDDMDYIVAYLCAIVAVLIGMEGKVFQRIIKSLLLLLLISSIDEVIDVLMGRAEELFYNIKNIQYWINLITSLWGLLILAIIFFFMKKRNKSSFLKTNIVVIIVILSGLTVIWTTAALNISSTYVDSELFQIIVDVVVSFSYICICALCWFLIYYREQNEEKAKLLEVERALKESQNSYYQLMLEKETETRQFRHDLTNHLFCLKEIANREDINEIKKYLDGMNGELQKIRQLSYSTGNELFDAILADKLSGIAENISVSVRGMFRYDLALEAIDICTIFSNLLQNAVEELNQIQELGELKIEILSGKQYTEIEIKNSTRNQIIFYKDGLPKTRKGDERNHGMGLQNVRKSVEKYHGKMEILCDENTFSVKISFEK